MCVMIAFYTLVFVNFMSDAITRFMVCFYLGYFVGAMCRKTLVFRRILFKCKSSSVTTCFAGK